MMGNGTGSPYGAPPGSTGDPPPFRPSRTVDPSYPSYRRVVNAAGTRLWDPDEPEGLQPPNWSEVSAYLRAFLRQRYQQRVDAAQDRVLNGLAHVAHRVYKQRLDRAEAASRLRDKRRNQAARNATQDAVLTVWFDVADRVAAAFKRLGASPPPESPR